MVEKKEYFRALFWIEARVEHAIRPGMKPAHNATYILYSVWFSEEFRTAKVPVLFTLLQLMVAVIDLS